jgi:bifunctional ADP-heptose synthase (sugar kinase/adenylyltransferase)
MLDRYVSREVSRISPEARSQSFGSLGFHTKLGGAANVAHDIAALGARHSCRRIGTDDAGVEIERVPQIVAVSCHGEDSIYPGFY